MRNTVITTPGRTRIIGRFDPLVDVICEHAGWDPDLLNDPAGIRRIQELTNDPAWCADSLNAGDRLREYLARTDRETVVLDVDGILATPVRDEYACQSHYHGPEYVAAHR